MKYAVHYNKTFRYYDNVDEVIFNYTGKANAEDLIKVVTTTLRKENQRAIINIEGFEKDIIELIPILNKLKKEHENILIGINFYSQLNWIEELNKEHLAFMFMSYADNLTKAAVMAKFGAKSIYVAEDLCFQLRLLQNIRNAGIELRIWPDIVQVPKGCFTFPQTANFFVRPEDISLYEKYVDVVEIFHQDSRQSVVYEIYKQEQWKGNLSDLIIDFSTNVSNTSFIPDFGRARLECGKRCTYSSCDICSYSEQVGENNYEFVKNKKKKEISPELLEQAEEILKEKGINYGSEVSKELVLDTEK